MALTTGKDIGTGAECFLTTDDEDGCLMASSDFQTTEAGSALSQLIHGVGQSAMNCAPTTSSHSGSPKKVPPPTSGSLSGHRTRYVQRVSARGTTPCKSREVLKGRVGECPSATKAGCSDVLKKVILVLLASRRNNGRIFSHDRVKGHILHAIAGRNNPRP